MTVWAFAGIWVASILVATVLGRRKRRHGVLYGVFLSWAGVLLILVLRPVYRPDHEDVRGAKWDETLKPNPDDAWFKNMQYYSRH